MLMADGTITDPTPNLPGQPIGCKWMANRLSITFHPGKTILVQVYPLSHIRILNSEVLKDDVQFQCFYFYILFQIENIFFTCYHGADIASDWD